MVARVESMATEIAASARVKLQELVLASALPSPLAADFERIVLC